MNSKTRRFRLVLLSAFILFTTAYGQVKLPKLICDGMVLQRNADVKIWGWATKNEKVSIHFNDSIYLATTYDSGKWEVKLSNLKAGGTYLMIINATNTIIVKDILIGDVWICSGQSNMELPMKKTGEISGIKAISLFFMYNWLILWKQKVNLQKAIGHY